VIQDIPMRAINHARLIACAVVSLHFALSYATSAWAVNEIEEPQSVIHISRVIAPSNPLMRNDSLIYSMDIIFEHLTGKFWSYMDYSSHVAFIEIYGADINAPVIHMPRCSPLRNMAVKNQQTKMSLSGKMSTISFTVDCGWVFDASQTDTNRLSLIFGKKMEIREVKESLADKKKSAFFGAVFSGIVAVSIMVAAIITKNE
jgi:hypothetical protein